MKFALFRELDSDFELDSQFNAHALRRQAADAIDGERSATHPGLLPNALAPFLKAVRVARHAGGDPMRDGDGNIVTGADFDALCGPILKEPTWAAIGIEAILRYVEEHECFHSMAEETYQDFQRAFSPIEAIRTRTNDIVKQAGPDAKFCHGRVPSERFD